MELFAKPKRFHTSQAELIGICAVTLWAPLAALPWPQPFERWLLTLLVGACAILASVHDWRTFRLPLVLTLGGATLAWCGFGLMGEPALIAGGLAGFLTLKIAQSFCLWRYRRKRPRQRVTVLGNGDALLMLSLGTLSGIEALPLVFCLAAAAALVFARCTARRGIPFGAFLTFASCTVSTVIRHCNG